MTIEKHQPFRNCIQYTNQILTGNLCIMHLLFPIKLPSRAVVCAVGGNTIKTNLISIWTARRPRPHNNIQGLVKRKRKKIRFNMSMPNMRYLRLIVTLSRESNVKTFIDSRTGLNMLRLINTHRWINPLVSNPKVFCNSRNLIVHQW